MSLNLFLAFASSLALGVHGQGVTGSTPPMGWNSYNTYGCNPRESVIRTNAQALVDLGLADLGYSSVTVDCGWPAKNRDAQGRLQWNPTLFPSGPVALGEFIHGLGLKFGLYSGAGYLQCGSTDLPASLGYEEIDAQSFADWGGDSLKYDNCYSTSSTTMVDSDSEESQSSHRFEKMAAMLKNTGRDIAYWICQWGIGKNVPQWAAPIGQTWRMSNDIYDSWRSIWRIVNQAIPHARYSRPGAFADLDMLLVGLGGLSHEEERFHFGLWAMLKSPLLIGADLADDVTPAESIEILANREVIAINQDPLGKAAELVLRNTEEEWDIWAGDLSEGRRVVGLANWRNETQAVTIDLGRILGINTATARDIWAGQDLGTVDYGTLGARQVELAGHQLKIWILDDIEEGPGLEPADYYSVAEGEHVSISGSGRLEKCAEGACALAGSVIRNFGAGVTVKFEGVAAASGGKKFVGLDFINYDYAFAGAWGWDTNTRNVTIGVNGGKQKRWALPLAGNDWSEAGRVMVELEGFEAGSGNSVVFGTVPGETWGPDLVGIQVFE